MKKLSNELFILRSEQNYPNYDYSNTTYNGLGERVKILCKTHGEFLTWPQYLRNPGRELCPYCSLEKNNRKLGKYTKNEILEKITKYADIFDIQNLDELVNKNDLLISDYIILKCKKCGYVVKKRIEHIIYVNYTCVKCKSVERKTKRAYEKMNQFLEKAKEAFPEYDYSNVKPYVKNNDVESYTITCPIHGDQKVSAYSFFRRGCPRCINHKQEKYKMINRKYTNEEFIQELINIYGDTYDYSKVNYVNWKKKVLLKCQKHGEFLREPSRLIKEHRGCPHCNKSLLELDMMKFLDDNNIKYIDLYHIDLKRLDFYLPEYNIGIECQGRLHLFLDSIFNTNVKSIEELYQIDKNKLNLAKNKGIKNILYFSTYKVDNYFEKLFTSKNELLLEIYKYEKLL